LSHGPLGYRTLSALERVLLRARRPPCITVARAHAPHSAKVCPVFFAFTLILRGFALDNFAVSRSLGRRSCSPGVLVSIPCLPGSCVSIALQLAAFFFFFINSLAALQQVIGEETFWLPGSVSAAHSAHCRHCVPEYFLLFCTMALLPCSVARLISSQV
jgi:hypothetical protein